MESPKNPVYSAHSTTEFICGGVMSELTHLSLFSGIGGLRFGGRVGEIQNSRAMRVGWLPKQRF
jgi:hypothetical protein